MKGDLHYISGYAFAKDFDEIAKKKKSVYEGNLKYLFNHTAVIEQQAVEQGKNTYIVNMPLNLVPSEILLWCDKGNGCFGGEVEELGDNRFRVAVYTE